MQPNILFEDSHLLIIEKPAGLPSQATPDGRVGAEDLIRTMIEQRDKKPGKAFLHVLHRLDGAVSGLLLFAKSSKALSRVTKEIREQKVEKFYVAVVEGQAPWTEGTLLLDFVAHSSHKAIAKSEKMGGKEAKLKIIRNIHLSENSSLLLLKLETGRYHQIRFQLSKRGFPIVGDHLYGSTREYEKGKILLHHAIISFCHPVVKKTYTFSSIPPWPALRSIVTPLLQALLRQKEVQEQNSEGAN